MATPVEAAVELLQRLPPEKVVESLASILELAPELTEELLSRVDQPLQVALDDVAGKEFLLCDYNRDADSYRSPWSNDYFPPLSDGTKPCAPLRVRHPSTRPHALTLERRQALEAQANDLFAAYREQYYEGGLSSVYLWENGGVGAPAPPGEPLSPQASFAGCFLVHKGEGSGRRGGGLERGLWDAVHVVEVLPSPGGQTQYRLSSTVALALATKASSASQEEGGAASTSHFALAGSLGRSSCASQPTPSSAAGHLVALGRAVEEMENKLRGTLDSVYFGKTRSVVNGLRASDGEMGAERRTSLQAGIMADMLKSSSLKAGGGPMGLPGGFDPKAALAGLRKSKPQPAE